MAKYSQNPLDTVFSALGDSTRRGMLEDLSHGEASVSQFAERFGVSLPTIHKHLRVLERAGLIRHEKRGRVRHVRLAHIPARKCESKTHPNVASMEKVKNWIAQLEAQWDEHLHRLKLQVESDI
jgi:DNA-binding transcriptional ArsR family regulator